MIEIAFHPLYGHYVLVAGQPVAGPFATDAQAEAAGYDLMAELERTARQMFRAPRYVRHPSLDYERALHYERQGERRRVPGARVR